MSKAEGHDSENIGNISKIIIILKMKIKGYTYALECCDGSSYTGSIKKIRTSS